MSKFIMYVCSVLIAFAFLCSATFAFGLNRSEIKKFQSVLNELGYDVGTPDGIPGRKTASALAQFRTDFGADGSIEIDQSDIELAREVKRSRFDKPTRFQQARLFKDERDNVSVDLSKHRNPCDPRQGCEPMDFLVAAMDIDADGDIDLVYGSYFTYHGKEVESGKPLIFLTNDGDGNFEQASFGLNIDLVHVRDALISDFNGDGYDDLFILDHGMDARPFPGAQNILLFMGPGGPTNVTETNLPNRIDFSHGGAVGDLDADGDQDILIIANVSQVLKHNSYVLENNGNGVFSINDKPDYIDFSLLDINSKGRDYSNLATAKIKDFDGDGHIDIAWLTAGEDDKLAKSKSGSKLTHITFNNGNNEYLSEYTIDLPLKRWGYRTFVTDLRQIDIDADGDLDLIATSNTREKKKYWRGSFIDVIRNDGERKFSNVTHEHMFSQGYENPDQQMWNHWVFIEDFNLDGRTDISVFSLDPVLTDYADWTKTPVKLALQNEKSEFVPMDPTWIVAGDYTMRRMRPVDIDSDGDVDLVGSRLLRQDTDAEPRSFVGFVVQIVENRTND